MGLIFDSTLVEIFAAFVLFCWGVYHHITKNYDYWAKRGVPHRKGVFPFGSMKDLVLTRVSLGDAYDAVYREFRGERYCGVYTVHCPVLVIRDPELIKQIMVADFTHFVDRDPFPSNSKEYLNHHLFLVGGDDWRNMRHKLAPAFTSGKMKNMFLLMLRCSENLGEYLEKTTKAQETFNVKELLAKFTMDVIATCAFGTEINSLRDENVQFYKTGISIFEPELSLFLKTMFMFIFPTVAKALNLNNNKPKPKKMFTEMIRDSVKYREENNISRNDFLDLLVKLKNNKSILDGTEDEDGLSNQSKGVASEALSVEDITAQSFIFFIAGFETASSTMTFCLYELAQHHDVQQRLSQEIQEVLQNHAGNVTYQALQEMKYMDQVINETLRMYASLSVLHRRCTKAYKVPGTDLVLEKGQKVFIPTFAIHHDPEYYPDPYKFDPERFSPENVKARHPYVHLPFGAGPRLCIGMRFGIMQTKMGLISVLSRFSVDVAKETPIPMQFMPISFVTQSRKPVHLKLMRRS